MKVAFLGATRGIGRSLSRLMAARGDDLFLLGRDVDDLERSARDLEARAGRGSVGAAHCDLEKPGGFASALDAAEARLGGLEAVVVTAGDFALQPDLEQDVERPHRVQSEGEQKVDVGSHASRPGGQARPQQATIAPSALHPKRAGGTGNVRPRGAHRTRGIVPFGTGGRRGRVGGGV